MYPATVLALNTGLRYSDMRLLKWQQVDLTSGEVTVGKSKTRCSSGLVVPLNQKAFEAMKSWAGQFPLRHPEDAVFPSERYGGPGNGFDACVYKTDPQRPIGSFKKAWQAAKKIAGVKCRFHDLRHTGCTRMLEAGAPFSVVASITGWSPSTTVLMANDTAILVRPRDEKQR